MTSTFKPGAFDAGKATDSMWQTMEQLRATFEKRVGTRMGRGDVRAAVLVLLAEEPMHGYQLIREIETRTGGSWKPSAGSVYPTLQLLADEGVITATEANGRKTYTLTDTGRTESTAASAPWENQGEGGLPGMPALPKAGLELAQAVSQVGRTGSPEQVKETVALLEETRRRVYGILAKD